MIYNLTENQSYDLKFLESYQASTAGNKVTFNQTLSPADITAIEAHFNEMTKAARVTENKRVKDITDEAVSRMHVLFEIISSLNDVKFFAAFWQSIAPAARQATPEFSHMINIYTAAKTAIQNGTLFDDVVWP